MTLRYVALPTLSRFHRSNARIRGIVGPYGSGKTVGCAMEAMRRITEQAPSSDGVRRSRGVVVRNTYGELRDTTLKSWLDWFPSDGRVGELRAASTSPVYHVRFPLDDGTRVEADVLFRALDKPGDERRLLSLELTWAWLNEFRELDINLVQNLLGRVGRYPSKTMGSPSWHGVFGDSNPYDVDSPWERLFEGDAEDLGFGAELVEFFRQPGGLDPDAENLENLPGGRGYYHEMVAVAKAKGRDQNWINVHVHARNGFIVEGRAVFGDAFDSATHVSKVPLRPVKGRIVGVGLDFGLTPAAVFVCPDERHRYLVLGELVAEDMAMDEFARLIRVTAQERWPGCQLVCYGDPAGKQRSQVDKRSGFDVVRASGMKIFAGEQSPQLRIDSVRACLNRSVGGYPGIILDPSCTFLIRGFIGGYQYRRLKISGERYGEKPDKNEFSHPHDALQYVLSFFEAKALTGGRRKGWPEETVRPRGELQQKQTGFWKNQRAQAKRSVIR